MTLRVRRAASTSMEARSRTAGRRIWRSFALSQVHSTPMLVSTSTIRLTSSIRASLRSVVVPRLIRLAHNSATPAFLLLLTSTAPARVRPPSTRRWVICGPAHLDDAVPDDRLQALDHLQAQVLLALFHPGDGALAGAQLGGELPLGPALGAARLAEQDAYVFSSRLSHAPENITHDL